MLNNQNVSSTFKNSVLGKQIKVFYHIVIHFLQFMRTLVAGLQIIVSQAGTVSIFAQNIKHLTFAGHTHKVSIS